MKQISFLALVAVLVMSASPVLAQGSAASMPSMATKSSMDCSKAARQKHDHAAESGRGTPHMQAHPCPPVTSASAASAAAAKKKLRHDHPSTK